MWWHQLDGDHVDATEPFGVVRHRGCREPDPAAGRHREWLVRDREGTHTVSLAESMKGDSASLRKIEPASYRSGYQGLYADGKKDGVLIGAFTYNNPAVALQLADSWSARNAAQIAHARLLHPQPASSAVGFRRGRARLRRAERWFPSTWPCGLMGTPSAVPSSLGTRRQPARGTGSRPPNTHA
jgi:hypothetical protein